jgi:HD-like signal output (HDOD) protein
MSLFHFFTTQDADRARAGSGPAGGMMRVLFVDDETHVLEGLRDALRPWRRELSMTFAADGPSALDALELEPYDAVVSDMRMPGMDGAELLREVQRVQPATVRIVLSGYAEIESVARAAPVAHRFLSKPCHVDELVNVIRRSCDINALVEQDELRNTAGGAGRLPSVPRLYSELTAMMGDPDASVADAARLVEQDTGMTAKVLQLANSAFCGRTRQISDLDAAISYLGLNTLKALALSADAMEAFQPTRDIAGFSIERLQVHAGLTARIARRLVVAGCDGDSAVAAALIHDVGILVLASRAPDYLAAVLERAEREDRALFEVEQEERGFTHADVSAHLLGLWGLPPAIVEAVAYHHRPAAAHGPAMDAITAVHVASVLADERVLELDMDHLKRMGVSEHVIARWRAIAAAEQEDDR